MVNSVGDYFHSIGQAMASQVGNHPDPHSVFAEIAAEVLREVPSPPIDVLAMADWAGRQQPLPKQVNFRSGFGQPPLVVFETPSFYIEVLFWFPSRTSIHGHAFTGAFRVLNGYSIQIEYEFQEASAPEEGVRLGKTVPRSIELIAPGRICPILPKDEFIHCVAHMGNPSLTLVARTHGLERTCGIKQYEYFRCGFACHSSLHKQSLIRLADVLCAVHQARREAFPNCAMECLRRADAFTFFSLLKLLLDRLPVAEFAQQVFLPARAEFGLARSSPLAALDEVMRAQFLWPMLRATPDPRRQLLMALDELLPDAREREALICQTHGAASSLAVIEEWARITQTAERLPQPA